MGRASIASGIKSIKAETPYLAKPPTNDLVIPSRSPPNESFFSIKKVLTASLLWSL